MAYSHGVFPLVYNTLKIYDDLIPYEQISYMKQTYMDIVKQNMLMTSEMIKILKILEENHIDAIPFKGPILSQLAYGDVISRQYVDLDILIKEENLEIVYDLLENNKFISTIEKIFLHNRLFLEKNNDIQFFHNKKNITIELHWKLFRTRFSNRFKNQLIFDMKNKVQINSCDIYIFKYEILLVYLCMHGSKHKWERIEWITDINKLVSKEMDINWEKVFEFAKENNCLKMLKLGLYISVTLYNTSIPKKYLIEMESRTYQNMIHYVFDEMSKIDNYKSQVNKSWNTLIFHINLYETFYERINFLQKTFFALSDNDTKSFNTNSVLLHYIIKPFRLLKKYFRNI